MPTNPSHNHPRTFPMAVAVDHRHGLSKPPTWHRRCRLRSFPNPEPALLNLHPSSSSPAILPHKADALSFHRSVSTPCLSTPASPGANADDSPANSTTSNNNIARLEIVGGQRGRGIHTLVVEAAVALASGIHPVPVSNGSGGSEAYFLRSHTGESFAVVKPVDEESPPFNILGRPGSRRLVRAGETGVREVAAYLLDHGGFSGVPPTALIKISHPAFTASLSPAPATKTASIHRFVPHDFDAGELGPSRFSVASVHRIGILDVRLLNIDRHAGNILVKKRSTKSGGHDGYDNYSSNEPATELVPIDHGLCLPELLDNPYFEWLHWPQAAVPFSDREAEYISSLDPSRDAGILRSELPSVSEAAIRILVLCTIFLKLAAGAGLCLADVGDMMTREFCGPEEGPSVLERLCKRADDSLGNKTPSSEDSSGEGEFYDSDEAKQFQFEMECGDGELTESHAEDVFDIRLPTQSKTEEEEEDREGDDDDGGSDEEPRLGGIVKSVSFSARKFNSDGSKCISFEGMSEEEWEQFLERFQQLLPEAFEARKGMGLKKRLGTSCKF